MTMTELELYHHGILGQKWGVRRYQNLDGSYTAAGKKRYDQTVSDYKAGKASKKDVFTAKQETKKAALMDRGKELKENGKDIKTLVDDREYAERKTFIKAITGTAIGAAMGIVGTAVGSNIIIGGAAAAGLATTGALVFSSLKDYAMRMDISSAAAYAKQNGTEAEKQLAVDYERKMQGEEDRARSRIYTNYAIAINNRRTGR